MEMEDTEAEVFLVTIAAGLPLEEVDLAVHDLQFTGADGVFVPVQDKRLPEQQLMGGLLQDGDVAGLGCSDPVVQFGPGPLGRAAVKE